MRIFPAGLALLVCCGLATAQNAASPDVDQQIYGSLRTVINYGADLYNNRDAAGCYHVFRTASVMLAPQLDHHPDLQKAVRDALAEAEMSPDMARRAWVLRRALDQVRAGVKQGAKAEEKKADPKIEDKKEEPKKEEPKKEEPKKEEPKEEPKKDEPKKEEPKTEDKKDEPKKEEKKEEQTLWLRLGGEPAVKQVIDDWFEMTANDPKVDLSRGGKFQPTPDQVDNLKKLLVAQISSASGGPLKYTGRDMKAVHKGMAITTAEFDAAASNLKKVMESHKVGAAEIQDVMKIVESTRKDIVEE